MLSYPKEVEHALILAQDTFAWEAPSHPYHERGPRWYIVMTVIALGLIGIALFNRNFLFALIILLIAMVLILAGHEEPKPILVQIGQNGVVWHGKLYLYQDFEHFAIIYQPPYTKLLYLEHRNSFVPRLRIPLDDQNPLELRDHLKQYLRENLDMQEEPISDVVARLLKI